MKIESSDVKISSQTKSSFEMISSSQLDFRHELLGLAKINENDGTIDFDTLEKVPSTYEVKSSTDYLEPYEEITKLILEMILQRFLGGNKALSMYPKDNCQNQTTALETEPKKLIVKHSASLERSVEYSKSDSIEFNTQAVIKTAQKDMNINLELSYSKEFYEKHSEKINFEEITFLDPLVIQYDCSSTAFDTLSETMCFNFDINSDGNSKDLPLLKDGNGFLVLDKNGNGTIDNGTELFGPKSNDGFAELSEYDTDGNDWIDENDPIFNDLRIWTKNEKGDDKLIGLGQSGIGALYLSDVSADMDYNKSVDKSLAHLKSNSIFLREDGTAGLISSLDFIA